MLGAQVRLHESALPSSLWPRHVAPAPNDRVPGLQEGGGRGLLPSVRSGFRCADTIPLARAVGGSAQIAGEGSVLVGRHVLGGSLWSLAVGIALVALESGLCALSPPGHKNHLRALLTFTSTSALKVCPLRAPGCELWAGESAPSLACILTDGCRGSTVSLKHTLSLTCVRPTAMGLFIHLGPGEPGTGGNFGAPLTLV